MKAFNLARYIIAFVVVACYSPAILLWVVIHPCAQFWRKLGPGGPDPSAELGSHCWEMMLNGKRYWKFNARVEEYCKFNLLTEEICPK